MRYGDRFCAICQRNGCVCGGTVVDSERLDRERAAVDDMRLPPPPRVPAIGRVVARDCCHAERLAGDERPCARCHALEHAEVALRAVATIRAHLDTPENRRRVVHDRDYWSSIALDHAARARVAVGVSHDEHEQNAREADAWAGFYAAILSLVLAPAAVPAVGSGSPKLEEPAAVERSGS